MEDIETHYECDQCGACCQGHLIVGAEALDVLREPRLIDVDRHFRGKSVRQVVSEIEDGMKMVTVACGGPCPFLKFDNRCAIYSTRPNDCVAMEAGDSQCQEARAAAGLPALVPINAPNTDASTPQAQRELDSQGKNTD